MKHQTNGTLAMLMRRIKASLDTDRWRTTPEQITERPAMKPQRLVGLTVKRGTK